MKAEVILSEIQVLETVLPRNSEGDLAAREYAEAMRLSDTFPPITVFQVGSKKILVDGRRRLWAKQYIGQTKAMVDLRRGNMAQAVWFAIGANRMHGVRLSPKERKKALANAIADPAVRETYSDEAIADQIGVERHTVAKARALWKERNEQGWVDHRKKEARTVRHRPLKPRSPEEETRAKLLNGLESWLGKVLKSDFLDTNHTKELISHVNHIRQLFVQVPKK